MYMILDSCRMFAIFACLCVYLDKVENDGGFAGPEIASHNSDLGRLDG